MKLVLTASLFCLLPSIAWAAEEPTAEAEHAAGEHAAGEHAEAEHHHAHHFAAFLGATTAEEATHPSVGLDYFYYLPVMDRRIGLGPLFDATFGGEATEMLFGLAVAAKGPVGLQLAMAPVLILVDSEKAWGGRLNLAYDFHVGEMYSVGPTVSADFLPHSVAYVYGLNVGLGL